MLGPQTRVWMHPFAEPFFETRNELMWLFDLYLCLQFQVCPRYFPIIPILASSINWLRAKMYRVIYSSLHKAVGFGAFFLNKYYPKLHYYVHSSTLSASVSVHHSHIPWCHLFTSWVRIADHFLSVLPLFVGLYSA